MWCVSDDDDGVDNHHDSAMQRIERLRTQALAAQGLPELLELDEAARWALFQPNEQRAGSATRGSRGRATAQPEGELRCVRLEARSMMKAA